MGDFPLLRFTDIRNDVVSTPNLWERFHLTNLNKELLNKLSSHEIEFNNSDKTNQSIHDLQKKNSIGFYFPIYIVKHPFLSTGKIKLKEWKNYFIKGAFHRRIEKTNYTLPPTNKLRDLKNSFFYILGKIYIKYTK